ncbi:hypothetical protein Hanom_Chr02g00108391 [Helianthus anomalus]
MKMAKSYKRWGQFGINMSFWTKMTNVPKPQGQFWQLTLFFFLFENLSKHRQLTYAPQCYN